MEKFVREWKWTIISGLSILFLASAVRLYNLTILPVFADEAIYIRWAQIMRAEPTLRFLPLSDGKQPLFMWLIIPFLKLISDPLFAGRIVSVLSGGGTLIGIFVFAYILFRDKLVSLLSGLFYIFSPFSFFFDRMALADSMLAMFGIWTLILAILTAKTKRFDLAMLTGFALGGALLTKSPAIFFVILFPTTWLIFDFPKSKKKIMIYLGKFFFLTLTSLILGYGIYNILRLGPNFNMIKVRNQDYVFPISHLFTNPKDPFIFLFDRTFEWLWAMGPGSVLLLAGLGILFNLRKNFKVIFFILICLMFPILVQAMYAKVYTARYIVFTLPYLFILAGSSFIFFKPKLLKLILSSLCLISLIWSLKFIYFLNTDIKKADLPRSEKSGYLEEWTAGDGIKEIADYLKREIEKEPYQRIVVGTEGFFGTLPDGLQMYLNHLSQIAVIGVGLDINEIPKSLVESKNFGNKTFLVVNKSRITKDYEKLPLKMISSYPKSPRPADVREYYTKGPQEILYFFEVLEALPQTGN